MTKISNDVLNKLINNSINVKQNKYHNKRVEYDGMKFDSIKEKNYYMKLKLLEKYGIIKDIRRQVKYELQASYEINGKKVRSINYYADFTYIEGDKKHIVDVKSEATRKDKVYRLKKKMFEYKYNMEIEEV